MGRLACSLRCAEGGIIYFILTAVDCGGGGGGGGGELRRRRRIAAANCGLQRIAAAAAAGQRQCRPLLTLLVWRDAGGRPRLGGFRLRPTVPPCVLHEGSNCGREGQPARCAPLLPPARGSDRSRSTGHLQRPRIRPHPYGAPPLAVHEGGRRTLFCCCCAPLRQVPGPGGGPADAPSCQGSCQRCDGRQRWAR